MRHLDHKTPTVRHGVDATVRKYKQGYAGITPTYYICEWICCNTFLFEYLYNTPDINVP